MPEYRAFIFGPDGHFSGFEEMVCDDDSKAIERAERLVDSHDVELWNGARMKLTMPQRSPQCHRLISPKHRCRAVLRSPSSAVGGWHCFRRRNHDGRPSNPDDRIVTPHVAAEVGRHGGRRDERQRRPPVSGERARLRTRRTVERPRRPQHDRTLNCVFQPIVSLQEPHSAGGRR
jgi:hypothetical protein